MAGVNYFWLKCSDLAGRPIHLIYKPDIYKRFRNLMSSSFYSSHDGLFCRGALLMADPRRSTSCFKVKRIN